MIFRLSFLVQYAQFQALRFPCKGIVCSTEPTKNQHPSARFTWFSGPHMKHLPAFPSKRTLIDVYVSHSYYDESTRDGKVRLLLSDKVHKGRSGWMEGSHFNMGNHCSFSLPTVSSKTEPQSSPDLNHIFVMVTMMTKSPNLKTSVI